MWPDGGRGCELHQGCSSHCHSLGANEQRCRGGASPLKMVVFLNDKRLATHPSLAKVYFSGLRSAFDPIFEQLLLCFGCVSAALHLVLLQLQVNIAALLLNCCAFCSSFYRIVFVSLL